MSVNAILIIAASIIVLIVGGKPLIRKKLYKDYTLFAILIAWSAFIAMSVVNNWRIASFVTSIALSNALFRPMGRMMHSFIGWGLE